jgi:hypothetical protein
VERGCNVNRKTNSNFSSRLIASHSIGRERYPEFRHAVQRVCSAAPWLAHQSGSTASALKKLAGDVGKWGRIST